MLYFTDFQRIAFGLKKMAITFCFYDIDILARYIPISFNKKKEI